MFKQASLSAGSNAGLKTGFERLDDLIGIGDGIITLRCDSANWLFTLAASMLVRNHSPSKRTLYLHWVDYHSRFWTIDYDFISACAKRIGANPSEVAGNLYFMRAFSADSVESEENWEKIMAFASDLNFAVLDSVSELYEERPGRAGDKVKSQTYAIGMFSRMCLKNECLGIVLDTSGRRIHPFLGELSSIILNLRIEKGLIAEVRKHPCMAERTIRIASWGQQDLRRWAG
jgi:hypothetical protein